MTDLIPGEAYLPFDPQGMLKEWGELLTTIDELPAVEGAREVATIKYAPRLQAKGWGTFPWDAKAAAQVVWSMGMSEAEMDHIPAVRHLERIAHEFLPLFPMAVHPDGDMAGICEISVTQTGAMACIFPDAGPEITLSFDRRTDGWHVALLLDWEVDIPISDLVVLDLGERFGSRLKTPGSWPATVMIEEDRVYATTDPAMFERLSPA